LGIEILQTCVDYLGKESDQPTKYSTTINWSREQLLNWWDF